MDPIIESIEETLARIGAKLETAPPHTTVHNALAVLWKQADKLRARAEHVAQHDVDGLVEAATIRTTKKESTCQKTNPRR